MGVFDFLKNPLSGIFNRNQVDTSLEDQAMSLGKSQQELDQISQMGPGELYSVHTKTTFQDTFNTKASRISFYRQMSLFPEISDALDHISDDGIIDNGDGQIITLDFHEPDKKLPKGIQKKVIKEFNFLINNVFKIKDQGWDLFRKFLIEGELYLEVILNKNKKTISALKILPAFTMVPVYEGNVIVKYAQVGIKNDKGGVEEKFFEPNQVLYINWGQYGINHLDIRGFLESSIRPYNQLKNMEDSVVIYRLVRAPERRIWNIATGKLPKGKAEEYIKKLISKYKKRINYNSQTGEIDTSQSVQALTEDFWFAKPEEGQGTTVDTLTSNLQLGEIEDVKYFMRKLYKTLKLPKTRWTDNEGATYSAGRLGEVTREEIKFARVVERVRNRFKKIILDALFLQLKLKKIDKKYLKNGLYDTIFTESNLYKEFKEREMVQAQIDVWSSVSSFVATPSNPDDGVFSMEFAMKKFMNLSDEDYDLNLKLRKEEIAKFEDTFPNSGEEEEDGEGEETPPEEPEEPEEPKKEPEEPEKEPEDSEIPDDTEI